MNKLRDKALAVAMTQKGMGERGGNNRGIHVNKYTRGHEGQLWCAAFVVWCYEAAFTLMMGKTEWEELTKPELAKFLLKLKAYDRLRARKVFAACTPTDHPDPGDIVLWSRGQGNNAQGHLGIFAKGDRQRGIFWAVEGNRGTYPADVDEFKHAFGEGGLIGFAKVPDVLP